MSESNIGKSIAGRLRNKYIIVGAQFKKDIFYSFEINILRSHIVGYSSKINHNACFNHSSIPWIRQNLSKKIRKSRPPKL